MFVSLSKYLYNLLFSRINFSLKVIDVFAKVIFYVSGCFAIEDTGLSFNRARFERLTLYSRLRTRVTWGFSNFINSSSGATGNSLLKNDVSSDIAIVTVADAIAATTDDNVVWKDDIYLKGYSDGSEMIKARIYLSRKHAAAAASSSSCTNSEDAHLRNTAPVQVPAASLMLPTLLYFHGGGFCVSHIDSADYDNMCSTFAKQGFSVISIEYRLAPEHRFPAAIEDAFAALRWCQEQKNLQDGDLNNTYNNVDNGSSRNDARYVPAHELLRFSDFSRLVVGGDSAGGNLSATLSHLARNKLGPDLKTMISSTSAVIPSPSLIKQLLLIYPSVDRTSNYKSSSDFEHGFIIPKIVTTFFTNAYKPIGMSNEVFNADFRVSPILFFGISGSSTDISKNSDTHIKSSNSTIQSDDCILPGLPPTTIITAELDPLKDAGERYASVLREHNVKVNFLEIKDTVHGFVTLPYLSETKNALKFIFDSIADSW